MSARIELPDAVIVMGDEDYQPSVEDMENFIRTIEKIAEDGGGVLVCSHPTSVIAKDVVRFRGKRFRIMPLADSE